MSNALCIILRKPPYGRLDAAEAIRHLAGAAANGFDATGLLMDDGVYLARAGHRTTEGWINLSTALTDLLARSAIVAVHGPSLRLRGLDETDLVPGCRVVGDAEAAALTGQAGVTLVY